MAIHTEENEHTIECDDCGTTLISEYGDSFIEFITKAKEVFGWIIISVDDKFLHYCSFCKLKSKNRK